MGTIYPRFDHYPTHPDISNKDFYFAVVFYTGGYSSGNNWKEPKVCFFSNSSGNPIFGQIFGHQRPKIRLGTLTCIGIKRLTPIRMNARKKWNWGNSFFKNFRKPHFRPNIWPYEAENETMNTKIYRDQETHPIRINARYEIIWANSFFKKFREPHFRANIWPLEGRK